MLVSFNVLWLRPSASSCSGPRGCWFRMTLNVNRFELRNRNRSTIPIILYTILTLQKPWPRPGMQGLGFIDIASFIIKRQQLVPLTSRQGGLDTNVKILGYADI